MHPYKASLRRLERLAAGASQPPAQPFSLDVTLTGKYQFTDIKPTKRRSGTLRGTASAMGVSGTCVLVCQLDEFAGTKLHTLSIPCEWSGRVYVESMRFIYCDGLSPKPKTPTERSLASMVTSSVERKSDPKYFEVPTSREAILALPAEG